MVAADGGGGGGTGDIRLTASTVNDIARSLDTEAGVVRGNGFGGQGGGGGIFGGSTAGQALGSTYEGAFNAEAQENEACISMLEEYGQGLRTSVTELEDTDALNAVALRKIGHFDPGEA